jgi:hypothetical protein
MIVIIFSMVALIAIFSLAALVMSGPVDESDAPRRRPSYSSSTEDLGGFRDMERFPSENSDDRML